MPLTKPMEPNLRAQPQNLRSFLYLSAFVAVSLGGWACSSGSHDDSGTGAGGNAGASSGHGGSSTTGGNGTGADAGQGDGSGTGGGSNSGVGGGGNPTAGGPSSGGSSNVGGGTSTAGNTSTGGGTATGGSTATAGTTSTGTTACDNGKDDDGDGLIDGFDPECTGPLDNDEGSFATGIPGDNKDPKWQDCFFDGNSGAGDDGCRYSTGCLTGELPQTDKNCQVSADCIKFCAPLVQNGCDCFGCCSVQLPDGSSIEVTEAATCSLANLDDTKACPRCTKSSLCGNECGECELCAGKTVADLPASCSPPPGTGGSANGGGTSTSGGGSHAGGTTGSGGTTGTGQTCDGGEQICGPGLAPCSGSDYCSFGCCIPAVR